MNGLNASNAVTVKTDQPISINQKLQLSLMTWASFNFATPIEPVKSLIDPIMKTNKSNSLLLWILGHLVAICMAYLYFGLKSPAPATLRQPYTQNSANHINNFVEEQNNT
jgi:hypothetical protein